MNEQVTYSNTTTRRAATELRMLGAHAAIAALALWYAWSIGRGAIIVVAALVAITLARFALSRRLTIEVTDQTVRWWFALGWASGSVARDRIVAGSTRSMWWYRYGVSGTLYGRMWVTGPGRMVQLDCRPPPSALLRTDDPDGLLHALGLTDAAALADAPFETRPAAAPQGDTSS